MIGRVQSFTIAAVVAGLIGPTAIAEEWTVASLASALEQSDRSDADRARDGGRKPAEVVTFVGIQPGMTVIDLIAASGYYTEVLSVAVGPEGTVYAQNPLSILRFRDGANDKALTARLADNRLSNVVRKDGTLDEIGFEPGTIDAALTALNFHDLYYMNSPEAAGGFLTAVYAALKPGGVLGLIDHVGNPDGDNAKLHRIDKQIAVNMATEAGFVLEAQSAVLANPDDDHTAMIFGPDMRGKTDRFVLRLRKSK